MAYTYEIDRRRNFVRIIVTGRDSVADILRRMREISNDLRFSPGMDVLNDFTGVTDLNLSADDIDGITKLQKALDDLIGGGRQAIVADQDLIYGLGRMYETLAEGRVSMKIRIFRQLREAEAWLGIDRPAGGNG
jgi:hypothetical protein